MSSSVLACTLLTELAIILVTIITTSADGMIPHFTAEPSSTIASHDSATTLTCRVHPADAVVRWKFDGEYFDENNSFGFKQIGTDLHIPSLPDNGHESEFQCVAKTKFGTLLSKPAKISKAVLRKFEDRSDLHLNVSEGSNCVIPCRAPYSRPPAKVLFRYNHSTIIDKDTDHYKILPSGNLEIIKVTAQDQGEYQCMSENTLRNRTRTAKHKIHLHVLKTEAPKQEPAVIMPTSNKKALVGDNIVLECSAVGNPQPVISWEKYGGKLIPDHHRQQFGNLYIDGVTLEDEGTYLCKASNGLNYLMKDGLKAIMLEVSKPPVIQSVDPVVNVSLGGLIELMCVVTGKPKPQITWYHNGNLLKSFAGDNRLYIRNAEAVSQGLYQCFGENSAGISHSTILVNVDVTKRDSGSVTLSDQDVVKIANSKGKSKTPAGRESSKRHKNRKSKKQSKRRKSKKRKNKHKKKAKNLERPELIPPNAPEVKQLSDTSVMLNWTVPEETGLPITFFRVQYKKVAPKKGNWVTEDIEIESHIRTYEVRGLKPRSVYKFRIAAVYADNDNRHGPNSERFEMKLDPEPVAKPPSKEPTIVEVTALDFQNIHALNVKWQVLNVVTSTPIEGFYIYYKPYHAKEPFQNVTLLEPSVRTHLLTNLLPGTEYLIRMQSFNAAGNSSFSNEVVEKTKGTGGPYSDIFPPTPAPGDVTLKPPVSTPEDEYPETIDENNQSSRSSRQTSSEMLYMILGIVLGVMMLLLIVFMFMCWWKQRQQRRMMDAMNSAVRYKFQDPSQRINSDSLHKKMLNGGLAINGINGTIANGHIPRNYHNMNINVNPLSEMDLNSTDGSNHFSSSTFHPNGTLPSNHRTSDNNCNNINQSKSLQNSLQRRNLHNPPSSGGEGEPLGSGESMANPPSPMCKHVPIGHNSDALDRRSLSNRSCDHGSYEHCDSSLSYDDTGGVNSSGRHRKRRRRPQCKEQTTKDQATNTDLSSNDGTMELSESNKAISSSQESGQLTKDNTQTFTTDSEILSTVPCSNPV